MTFRSSAIAALISSLFVPSLAAAATPRDDAAAERLGFKLSLQCYTFRELSFFETVDKAAALGVKYLEMYPGQRLKPGSGVVTSSAMSEEVCREIKKKLASSGGLKLVAYGVAEVPADEQTARRTYEWAKRMGIEVLVTETTPTAVHDKLSTEYGIKFAIHNHPWSWPPERVLAACKDRAKLDRLLRRHGPLDAEEPCPGRYAEAAQRPHHAPALQGPRPLRSCRPGRALGHRPRRRQGHDAGTEAAGLPRLLFHRVRARQRAGTHGKPPQVRRLLRQNGRGNLDAAAGNAKMMAEFRRRKGGAG